MTGSTASDDEAWILSTVEGNALLAEVAAVSSPQPADFARWRLRAPSERVSAALRLAESRRRGRAKFARAGQMWFDRTGLEQSTSEPVARHKAKRFAAPGRLVVDLCSGIGGDTLALASVAKVIAVDADLAMCRRTLWNASAYNLRDQVLAVQGRAEAISIPAGAWVHIDPDRRLQKPTRAKNIDEYVPNLAFLQALPRLAEAGAVKLGPASDFEDHFDGPDHEIELVSLAGECKEATAWFGATRSCRRRATCLPRFATWTDLDGPAYAFAPAGPVLPWVFDPDPALRRSGLMDAFAAVHGLTRFVNGADFLTGPDLLDSPFLTPFEVLASLPMDLKRIKRELQARAVGTLEIKTRGVTLRPEDLRVALRVKGPESATLLLAAGHDEARAVIARRHPLKPR